MNAYRENGTIIAPRRAEGPDALGDAWITLKPGTPEYQMWDDWLRSVEGASPATVQAAADGDDNQLRDYWTKGEGLAKWAASAHPWTELVEHLTKYVGRERAERMASQWFKQVFGLWPGERKGENPAGPG